MSSEQQFRHTKPASLRKGDTVAIVAPASNIQRDALQLGCEALERQGYKPLFFNSIFDQELYFAGSAERRARELEEMFESEEVRAIICARGGYGANYLLNKIDPEKIITNPKIFVGYSDITTLLTTFADSARFVTFHGPMVTKDFALPDHIDWQSWESALTGATEWEIDTGADSGVKGLVSGEAEGMLYGGCLSMLVASLGTPYEIRTEGTILFIEDVAAKPYQIDRMLMQLKLADKLKNVRGIIFGEMIDCYQVKDQGYTLEQVVMRIVGDLGVPVAFGLRSGHVSKKNVTLPIGVKAQLKVQDGVVKLKIVEAATAG
jgi:muramoyltetrapeptide carboxypeptidase